VTYNKGYNIWSVHDYELECSDPEEANKSTDKIKVKMMSLDTQEIKFYPSQGNKEWISSYSIVALSIPGLLLGVIYYTFKYKKHTSSVSLLKANNGLEL
jgi:hypothetical protein